MNLTCSHELDSQRAGSLGALALTPCTETEVATGGTGVRLGCSVSTGSTSPLVTTGTVASRACTTTTTSSSSSRRVLYHSETLNTNFSIPVTAIYKSGKMEIEGTGPDSTGTWTATLVASVKSPTTNDPCGDGVRGLFSGTVEVVAAAT